ncbi:TPA: hypothetical protein ROX88_001345 [Bacillus pseudomycoides]|nr:hypothetical protein [Bacillus pseudomycoides]
MINCMAVATPLTAMEAIYNAIQRILHLQCELADYRILSITQEQGALAHVHVELKEDGHQVSGFGIAQDVLDAAVCACVYAVEKLKALQSLTKS